MPYTPFPIVDVDVTALHLDRSNFRIDDVLPSESAAITYLFAEHDVLGLARQILIEGYVDNELILAIEEDGKYVVLEGNRRTTALKALLDPSVAPGEARASLELLKRRHEIEVDDLPAKVRVMVAPNRAATQMLLARLHIGQSKIGWGRDAQARFVIAQLESGMSISMIRQELPGVKNAAAYVRQYHVRKILKEARFKDPSVAKYAASPRLRMTSFEYAYGNPDIQKVLGLSFDKEGVPTSIPTSSVEIQALERLVALFQSNELNTRKFPKRTSVTYDTEMRTLIAALTGKEPEKSGASTKSDSPDDESQVPEGESGDGGDPEGSGESTAKGGSVGGGAPSGGEAGGGRGRGPNNPDTLKTLHIALDYRDAPVGVRKRLNELRSLDLGNHPIAAAVLMRSVIEASIKWHFSARSAHVSGELGTVMGEVAKSYASHRPLRNAIELLRDGSRRNVRSGSLHWFNMAAHDSNHVVDAQSVRDAWQHVEQFVGFMLTPAPSTPSA
ncbi:MAG TPA: hypothetical protein VN041_07275 [Microbacterium sp.]|nr:hypothetical protein [Microbacterium sp.]